MIETVFNVFDVARPNPLKLQELSSLAVVAELWRRKIRLYLRNLEAKPISIHELISRIVIEKVLPDMPRRIYDLLNKYIAGVGESIVRWLHDHSIKVFRTAYDGWNEILSVFDDFALDWNGTIDEVRTARRMLQCDRIGVHEKFMIACLYCFEDDIKRIWPSVSSTMDLDGMYFSELPLLYYWICFLRNELHKVPSNRYDEPIDDMMLHESEPRNYSCALYFWKRIPWNRQSLTIVPCIYENSPELYTRYILPTLNEPQLVEFLDHRGEGLMLDRLIDEDREDIDLVLPIWIYIKNKLDKKNFVALIQELLDAEANGFYPRAPVKYEIEVSLCCEIWNSASQSFKQSVFDSMLTKEWSFRPVAVKIPRETRFLMAVLLDASFEERSAFWNKYWPSLIVGICVEDLYEIMKLCFKNEEEMALFKENTMFKYGSISGYLMTMWAAIYCSRGDLGDLSIIPGELNRLLFFCNSDAVKRLEMKQRYLRDPHNVFRYRDFLSQNEEFANEFLNDSV